MAVTHGPTRRNHGDKNHFQSPGTKRSYAYLVVVLVLRIHPGNRRPVVHNRLVAVHTHLAVVDIHLVDHNRLVVHRRLVALGRGNHRRLDIPAEKKTIENYWKFGSVRFSKHKFLFQIGVLLNTIPINIQNTNFPNLGKESCDSHYIHRRHVGTVMNPNRRTSRRQHFKFEY